MPNFMALQALGCRNKNFSDPKDINVSNMSMGSWKASLQQDGALHVRSRGGARKMTGKAKLRFTIGGYKDKIFNTTLLKIK